MLNSLSRLSLKFKISIAITSLVFAMLVIAGFLINLANRAETKKFNEIIIKASFDDVRQILQLFIQARWNDLKDVARSGIPDNEDLVYKQVNYLNQKEEKIYESLFVLDDLGKVVASSDLTLLEQDYSASDIFLAAKNGSHFELQAEEDGRVFGYFSLNRNGLTYVAKIDNDRISDLCQSARPYPLSSDNYLFTLKPSKIGPTATAISRSAFESDLLNGIPITNGEVKVKKNTEIELKFLDPETGNPTLGVQNIIDHGSSNDMIGYPDYRHIPVVGIGGTIKYADDFTAGLLAEADLNVIGVGIHGKDEAILNYLMVFGVVLLVLCVIAGYFIASYITRRVGRILEFTSKSEDFSFRLAKQSPDELGKLVVSINSFLDTRQKMITEINSASEESRKLAEQGVRFQQMIDNMPMNILLADLDGTIIEANPASRNVLKQLEKMLPFRVEEVVGSSCDVFIRNGGIEDEILMNPDNLPLSSIVEIGPERLDLLISPIFNNAGIYTGAMLTWSMVTSKIKADEHKSRVQTELAVTIHTLSESSKNLESNSESLSANVNRISEISDKVQDYINTVSVSAQEMTSNIREISKSTDKAAWMTQNAVGQMMSTEVIVRTLRERSEEIASILELVTEIASQTNFLALNATLEAARAGEAGRGFAVVANEVKGLANRTMAATDDIGKKIEAIQEETLSALTSIETASVSVRSINEVALSIAGSVESQTSVTAEIGRSMRSSTAKVSEMAQDIAGVIDIVRSNVDRTVEIKAVTGKLEDLIR